MLIEIDPTAVNDALGTGTSAGLSRECIGNLLLAHHAGKHVVYVGKEAITRLDSLKETWSPQARGALQSIRGRHAEFLGLRDRLKWILRVGIGPDFSCKTVSEDGKTSIYVSLHHFHDPVRALSGTVLLAEHLDDTTLYRLFGEFFITERGWKWNLCFDERLGGGSSTAPVFQKLVDEEKVTLAIVDSDRTYPQGALGGTAYAASKVQCSALQWLHIIHVRAAENLLPSSIYEQAFHDTPKLGQPLRDLQALEQQTTQHIWRDHAEFKEGITLFDIATFPKDDASFWRSAAKSLQRHACTNPDQALSCGWDKKNRRCFVTPALSDKALHLAVSWMQRQDRRRVAKLIRLREDPRLLDLCETIVAWGIAERRGLRA